MAAIMLSDHGSPPPLQHKLAAQIELVFRRIEHFTYLFGCGGNLSHTTISVLWNFMTGYYLSVCFKQLKIANLRYTVFGCIYFFDNKII